MVGAPTPLRENQRGVAEPVDAQIAETLKALARAVRSFQLYLPNNPMHVRALDSARAAFASLWAATDSFELMVTETDFLHEDVPVYSETDRGGESLPWLFYKDGIRTFQFRRGFELRELQRFLGAIQAVRSQGGGDEDLVTLFWECDFGCFSYTYQEAPGDGYDAPGAELLRGGARSGTVDAPSETEADAGTYGTPNASQFARIGDFDPTLYFLEEQEVGYLQRAIREDFSSDLRLSVAAALLDTFEAQDDPTVREEICGILEQFIVALLSELEFRTAAFLLRECDIACSRARELLPSHRERLGQLVRQMSEPATVGQLLAALEDISLAPPQQDLVALFNQLMPSALQPLLAHLVRTRNAGLRVLVEGSVNRIASANTEALAALIGADDESVALEAIRRAGALATPAAVAPLAEVLDSNHDARRAAAVEALRLVGTPGAMRAMERAIDDTDRDVRIAAVRAFADRQYRQVVPRLENAIRDRVVREGSSAEKTAFFEAYVALAGDAAVPLLESVLVPRGMLARKEDPATRASAAMALGRLGTDRALDVVRKVRDDKEVIVRTAATRALRGTE